MGAEDITAAPQRPCLHLPSPGRRGGAAAGQKLTANDLKILYTLYDHLALPTEVIFLLVNWCVEEMERKYGPGRKPFLSQIRREGFVWARKGSTRWKRQSAISRPWCGCGAAEREVLRLLDIPPRPLVEREKNYIAAWDQMGFDNEALRAAYERTVMKKQSMDWSYMNGILRRWHEKGLHTLAAIQSGDRDPRPVQAAAPHPSSPPPGRRSRPGRIWSGCAA